VGFVRQKKIFKLVFADPEMEGLEVRIRSMSIEQALDVAELATVAANQRDRIYQLTDALAAGIVSWNLEELDDQEVPQPVPATAAGLRSQDLDLLLAIVRAWINAVLAVSPPLAKPSPDGGPSLEASIPMESPLPSPPNSTVPN
jgi:hypothetical protein